MAVSGGFAKRANLVANVRDYGAKGDGAHSLGWWDTAYDTANVNVTGTALTCATGGFTDADVGKIIVIAGAGAAAAPFYTTIAARVSGTAVTLTAAVTTNVTNSTAYWGSDDTAAIAAAVATGKPVYFPKGHYLTDKITPGERQSMFGDGQGLSFLSPATASNTCLIEITGSTKQMQGFRLEKLALLGPGEDANHMRGVWVHDLKTDMDQVVIDDCLFSRFGGELFYSGNYWTNDLWNGSGSPSGNTESNLWSGQISNCRFAFGGRDQIRMDNVGPGFLFLRNTHTHVRGDGTYHRASVYNTWLKRDVPPANGSADPGAAATVRWGVVVDLGYVTMIDCNMGNSSADAPYKGGMVAFGFAAGSGQATFIGCNFEGMLVGLLVGGTPFLSVDNCKFWYPVDGQGVAVISLLTWHARPMRFKNCAFAKVAPNTWKYNCPIQSASGFDYIFETCDFDDGAAITIGDEYGGLVLAPTIESTYSGYIGGSGGYATRARINRLNVQNELFLELHGAGSTPITSSENESDRCYLGPNSTVTVGPRQPTGTLAGTGTLTPSPALFDEQTISTSAASLAIADPAAAPPHNTIYLLSISSSAATTLSQTGSAWDFPESTTWTTTVAGKRHVYTFRYNSATSHYEAAGAPLEF